MFMLHAASLGLPFLPVRFMIGSGLVDEWGISKEVRQTIDKLSDDKFVYVENPFKPGEKVVALPVPELDTAIIHVQKASPDGTCILLGDEFHDIDIVVAAKKVIVTCEELDYDNAFLKANGSASKTEEDFKAFLNEYVYDIKDNAEFLEKIGINRLLKLKVSDGYGYSTDVSKED